MTQRVSVVFPIYGRPRYAEEAIGQAVAVLKKFRKRAEFVFVIDSSEWRTYPFVEMLSADFPNHIGITSSSRLAAAALLNLGLEAANGEFVVLFDPLEEFSESVLDALLAMQAAGPQDLLCVVNKRVIQEHGLPFMPSAPLLKQWMLFGYILHLNNCLIPTSAARQIGGLDTSPTLARHARWDFILRALAPCRPAILGHYTCDLPLTALNLSDVRNRRPTRVSDDIAGRLIVRGQSDFTREGLTRRSSKFLADLPREDAIYLREDPHDLSSLLSLRETKSNAGAETRPLKIAITSGIWDFHHNLLCFYNYLRHLEGNGFATHRILLEDVVTEGDLVGNDLVILSRARSSNARTIVDACRTLHIPTLYMIDDNWFTVGDDWPEQYADAFAPGSPIMTAFLYCIENCDVVLSYNKLLIADLQAHAGRVVSLPNSVDLAFFCRYRRPSRRGDRFVVGYSGTPRYDPAPFEALSQLARSHPEVVILLIGDPMSSPALSEIFKGVSVEFIPMQSYEHYAADIRAAAPDILIAPLDASRTSMSKCPNKFLEITAAGAVGVYTEISPYTSIVENGKTGIFVSPNASAAEWLAAITRLLDRQVLAQMKEASQQVVRAHYDVPVVAEQFRGLIESIVAEARER